jgi:thiamine biosynthesis lipoprotein
MKQNLLRGLILAVIVLVILFIGLHNGRGEYIKLAGFTQGTTYHITYKSRDGKNLQHEIDSLLKDFDMSLSLYVPNSIVSRINRNDPTVEADEKLAAVFKESASVNKKTGGVFDITVAPLVNAWGFGFKATESNDSAVIDSLLQYVGMEKVKLSGKKVIKAFPQVMLDFNAIAQGYSVDLVSLYLEKQGVKDYLVEIGGEVRTRGRNEKGNSWRIGIDKPVEGNMIPGASMQAIITLNRRSLATSGNYRKFYEKDGIKYAHTINPKTGYPVISNLLSATVVANDCMTADAYATAFMVMGLDQSKKFLADHKYLEAYLIYSDDKGNFRVFFTQGLEEMLEEVQ